KIRVNRAVRHQVGEACVDNGNTSFRSVCMQDHALADQAEYVLPDDEVIITHTDASSHITYANSAFLKSSEFTIEECLGQPQNIVRHPDMPREVCADLWATIRSGEPWVGIVKNRRKHGGFY